MHEPTAINEVNDIVLGVYPNPTHGATKISFNLVHSGDVSLDIFNTSGQLVYTLKNVNQPSGSQMIYWDGKSNTGAQLTPGYYFVKVSAGDKTAVKKLVLMN
ncbi:MAG: T9SS type A sorting domain-containing protein [Chlorobi bacterium]|nr:T9SS type A sorting domain-containing protein [Chlorobiota bacterium]